MRKTPILAAMAAATLLSSPALAGSPDGRWQVKLLGTGVLPDGKITELKNNAIGLPAGSQTKANDNVVPTLAVEYFFSPNISAETICCLTTAPRQRRGTDCRDRHRRSRHDPARDGDAEICISIPVLGSSPTSGSGPSVFFYIDEKPGATTRALGGTSLNLENKFGFVLQAGVDIPVNDKGLGISLDGKKYFVNTVLHVRNAAGTDVLRPNTRSTLGGQRRAQLPLLKRQVSPPRPPALRGRE